MADAYNRIGDCLFNDRQFAAAEENYNRAVGLQPSAADYALYQKGFVMGLQKDYTGKIRVMDQLIRDYPQSQYADDALYEKGRAYVLLENNAKAAEAFGELVARYPNGSLAPKGGVQLGLLEKNLTWISLFIALAPSLGFLGTVVGMVQAFDKIQQVGDISPTVVAGGMKVALLTTIFGLIVAMILQVFFNYLLTLIEGLTNDMEDASISLLDIVVKHSGK